MIEYVTELKLPPVEIMSQNRRLPEQVILSIGHLKPSSSAILMTLLGLVLRLYGLTRDGYWIDESSAVLVAKHNFSTIVEGLSVRLHPPLFYFLLHIWMQIGDSEFVVRLVSVLCGVLTIALVYRLGRDMLGQRPATAAAFLLALSPAHTWYSQEARMYALLTLLCTLSFYFGWRWTERGRTAYWLGYVASSAAALYTQYVAAFALIAGALGFTIFLSLQRRYRDLGVWWLAQACVALAFLPWLPTWISQIGLDTPWIGKPGWSNIRQTWIYLGFGATWNGSLWSYLRLSLVLSTIGLALFYVLRRKETDNLLLPLAHSLIPALLITGVSFVRPVYQNKQFLIALPALAILMGWTFSRGRSIQFLLGMTLVSALTVGPVVQNYTVNQKQQWREVSQYIEAHWKPDDVVYYNAGVASAGTALYLDDSLPQTGYPILFDIHKSGRYGWKINADKVADQFNRLAQRHRRLWLIRYYPTYWDPEGYIVDWLNEHTRPEPVPAFHGVDLELYIFDMD